MICKINSVRNLTSYFLNYVADIYISGIKNCVGASLL